MFNSVHVEPSAPGGKEISSTVRETIERLADFVGAKDVVYKDHIPAAWTGALR